MRSGVESILPKIASGYRLETLAGFRSRHLGNARDVRVARWGMEQGGGKKEVGRANVSLLVLNDGQDLEALGVLETLGAMADSGDIVAPMVIAIPANRERMMEYGIVGEPDSRGRGARAGDYMRFLLEEVLPAVQRHRLVQFHASRSAILGASLGGLSAFDLAWRHPRVFGVCGVFSGSFWWRSDSSSLAARQASRITHRLVRETRNIDPARAALRFWLQAGSEDESEDRDGDGVIDAIQDTTELIDELAAKGWSRGRNVVYREVPGGRHEPATWSGVFGEFARFAFA